MKERRVKKVSCEEVKRDGEGDGEAGFSIFELLIVILILSTILVAVASNMAKTVRVLWENRSRSIAVNMAQNCIEDFNFNNSWRDWADFMQSDLSQYCLKGTTDLCGGAIGNECSTSGYDAVPIDILSQAPTVSSPQMINKLPDPAKQEGTSNEVKFLDANPPRQHGSQMVKRIYYDPKSITGYIFEIKRYPASVTYVEGVREVGGGQVVIKEEKRIREAMVVVVDVYWEKSSGASLSEAKNKNESNHYQVAKQFMAEKE